MRTPKSDDPRKPADLTLEDMLERLLDKHPEDGGEIRRAIWEARRLMGENADLQAEINQMHLDYTNEDTRN